MKLYIKNMVCNRCKTIVKAELDKIGIHYLSVDLGEVTINKRITRGQHTRLYAALQLSGFELIDEMKNAVFEKLKMAIVNLEHNSDENLKINYSDYISLSLNDNFISLNMLFAEIAGITIEKFIIRHKIELAKELLIYNHLNLSQIALKLHYNTVAQLSGQFKSITGLTPAHFRELRQQSNMDPPCNCTTSTINMQS